MELLIERNDKKSEGENTEAEYLAFISYRHADNTEEDRQWATWLHQQLEVYDIPADLIGITNLRGEIVPERIYPVFRDEVSLPADADLSHAITNALDRSRFLIVLCSPRAVQSFYVNEEILHFKRTGKQSQIMAALILGEPNASIDEAKLEDPEDASTLECFPEALQYHLKADGKLDTTKPTEPIAANFRLPDGGKGITNPQVYKQLLLTQGRNKKDAERLANAYEEQLNTAKLKIIAGILGVRLEQLTQRDKIHQLNKAKAASKRLMRIAGLMTVLAVVAVIGGGVAYTQWQRAEELLFQVRKNLSFMNHDLHTVLEKYVPQDKRIPIMQKIDVMVGVLRTSYSSQSAEAQRETAVALAQKADLILRNSGLNPTQALPLYEEANKIFKSLLKQDPMDTQFQHDVSVLHNKLGDVLLRLGQTEAALTRYETSLKMGEALVKQNPTDTQFQRDMLVSHEKLGDIQLRLGETGLALTHYETSLKMGEALVKQSPANTQFQRDVSVLHNKLGGNLLRLGQTEVALTHYETSLEMGKALVKQDSTNTQFLRDVSAWHNKLGDIQLRLGETKVALTHYETSLEMGKVLVKQDPTNTQFQRDVLVSHNKFGDVLLRLGQTEVALTRYEKSLEMGKALVKQDPTNAQFQRDVSVSLNRLGDIQLRLGEAGLALTHYETSLEMGKALVKQDPMNTQFQRDVSVSFTKLGNNQLHLGETEAALKHYKASLEIAESLVKQDPMNTQFLRNVSVLLTKLGGVQLRLGETVAALTYYEASLEIAEALIKQYPRNMQFQRDVSASHNDLGNIQLHLGKTEAAVTHYEVSLEIVQKLSVQFPTHAEFKRQLAISNNTLGYILSNHTTDYKKAYMLLERAVELSPNDPDILDSLGWVSYKLGKFNEAREYLSSAYKKAAKAEIAAHLGEVLWKSGNKERALSVWKEAKKDDPDDEVLNETMNRLYLVK